MISTKSIKPILYSSIEQKNDLEQKFSAPLSPTESLIHCLNMMDFYAALRKGEPREEDLTHPWIILHFKR